MLEKVLIANRGEIAVRIVRACRELGIRSVAVYSDADERALHVRLADEAVHIGATPSRESYLDQDRILSAAQDSGADAVHPGYGFLSENASFAQAVQDAGLVFVGPSPEAMRKMGDKVSARGHAQESGVPVAPGTDTLSDADDAAEQAKTIGIPVMLKAVAGGGGMGMRVVRDGDDVRKAYEDCSAQADAAFGDGSVFMEKYVERPRHIEVQVLGDEKGNVIHLYERECSIQRRHQKLVEEAPSPALTQRERDEIGEKAVRLARHVGYSNAGTMEFLYEDGSFYFNEMNTRLQVEHPVTEMVTGIDLVHWQLRIAGGEELTLAQDDIRLEGHAFEARITAEDPTHDFRPTPGTVRRLRLPGRPGTRVDSGLYEGWTVPSAYDSLVLKLLVHAPDREAAVRGMQDALAELAVDGFTTNRLFHQRLFAHPAFQKADLSTRFLEEHDVMQTGSAPDGRALARVAALVAALKDRPGGGLAGVHLEQSLPTVRSRTPAKRDWGQA